MIDALNARFRWVVVYAIAAVVIAALLRHGAHVYAGYSREEIRDAALMTVPMVAVLLTFLQCSARG